MAKRRISTRVAGFIVVVLGLVVVMIGLTAVATTVQAQLSWPTYALTKTVSYPPSADGGVFVGEAFTITLAFENEWTENTSVTVWDENPKPWYLEILSDTITGGANYDPGEPPETKEKVVWSGTLEPNEPVTVTFQMRVTGGAGQTVTNEAWLDDPGTPATEPDAQAEADIQIRSVAFLPPVFRNWPPPPETPVLEPISNPDGDGSYTVNWGAVPEADNYVLQEATDPVFSGAAPIYNGLDTGYDVTSRGAARYHYRVKASNSLGDSDWSSAQSVDVLWELEPNDRADQANGPIMSSLTYFGTFPGAYDVNDYYYFDLSATRRVELWLRNIPAGHNYDLVLRNRNLNSVGYSGELGNTDEHILTGALIPGLYYVQVYHRSVSGSAQAYHLKVVYE